MDNHAHRKRNPYYVPGNAVHSRKAQRFHGNLMDRLGRKHQIDDLRRGFATGGLVTLTVPQADWDYSLADAHWLPSEAVEALKERVAWRETLEKVMNEGEMHFKSPEKSANTREFGAFSRENQPIIIECGKVFGKTAVIEQLKADIASGNVVIRTTNFPPETREGEQ